MSPDRRSSLPQSIEHMSLFFRDNPPIYTNSELLEKNVDEIIQGSLLPFVGYLYVDYTMSANGGYHKSGRTYAKLDEYIQMYTSAMYRIKSKDAFPEYLKFGEHTYKAYEQYKFTVLETELIKPGDGRYSRNLIGFINPSY